MHCQFLTKSKGITIMTTTFNAGNDIIDVRDVISRVEDLREELESVKDDTSEQAAYNRRTKVGRERVEAISAEFFATKKELVQHYLDLNTGGTPHSEAEIERVKEMLK